MGAYLDTAGAIEGNFLSYWSNTSKATKVDTEAAVYRPCAIPVFWWIINCPSFGPRTMRLAKFTEGRGAALSPRPATLPASSTSTSPSR
ncbi:MAG: hypothetical protein R2696_15460 [Microthrixaceae bacterium]